MTPQYSHREHEAELDLVLSLFFASIPAVLVLVIAGRLFSVRHRDSVWVDSLRGSSTIVCSMRVLMVFGNSAMPRDLLQKFLSLYNRGRLLANCRRHGNRRYRLRIIIVILVLPLPPLLRMPPLLLMLIMTVRANAGFFP